jgi:hypothetical protein
MRSGTTHSTNKIDPARWLNPAIRIENPPDATGGL